LDSKKRVFIGKKHQKFY